MVDAKPSGRGEIKFVTAQVLDREKPRKKALTVYIVTLKHSSFGNKSFEESPFSGGFTLRVLSTCDCGRSGFATVSR